jgi:hypothetical protein
MTFAELSTATVLGATIVVSPALASDRVLKKSDLPVAVQKVVDAQSKTGTVRLYASEVEAGILRYEIEMTVSGHSRDLIVAPDGHLLEVEEEVALNALPAPVRQGLRDAAGDARIKKVESLTKENKVVAYEALIVAAGKRSEIQVGPDGKPLRHQ